MDEGCVSRAWGYRHEERSTAPLLTALAKGTTPCLLHGFRKPDVLPGHPELAIVQPSEENMAAALTQWAGEWGREWVVIDNHPGASSSAHGALSVADVVIAPTTLVADVVIAPTTLPTYELNATEGMVKEMGDYPLILVPNMVPRGTARSRDRPARPHLEGAPIQVGPPIPTATAVGTRKIEWP